MKRERGAFRTAAVGAKKRLAGGYWADASGHDIVRQAVDSRRLYHTDEDDLFYDRVEEMLMRGVAHPLPLLLDREYMATLSESMRERYVLIMSRKVQECVQKYNSRAKIAM